jgi:hypothetical protein
MRPVLGSSTHRLQIVEKYFFMNPSQCSSGQWHCLKNGMSGFDPAGAYKAFYGKHSNSDMNFDVINIVCGDLQLGKKALAQKYLCTQEQKIVMK